MHYVYILQLSNNTYYVGRTKDIESRLKNHLKGEVISTSRFESKKLIWYGAFDNKRKALEFEKYLKTGSGKAFRNKRLI
jgi:putative endonuclease